MNLLDDFAYELSDRGFVKIWSSVDLSRIDAARKMIDELAQAHGLLGDDEWRKPEHSSEKFSRFRRALDRLTASAEFPSILGHDLTMLLSGIVSEPLVPASDGPQALFALPGKTDWFVKAGPQPNGAIPFNQNKKHVLRTICFLDEITPEASPMLLAAGSHRPWRSVANVASSSGKETVIEQLCDQQIKRSRQQLLDELNDAYGEFNLEFCEVSGEPGEIYLIDARLTQVALRSEAQRMHTILTRPFCRKVADDAPHRREQVCEQER